MDHDLKHCPVCNNDLPVDKFGMCKARKDGRNLYCKSCIRQKVTQSRRALKEYKSARKRFMERATEVLQDDPITTHSPRLLVRESPVDRVRKAIKNGAHTQLGIAQETKLGKDVIGDALAALLLWTCEIKTELRGDERIYFFTGEKVEIVVQRKQDVPSGFHCLYELGPGRKRAIG
jgi:hypothetical protein